MYSLIRSKTMRLVTGRRRQLISPQTEFFRSKINARGLRNIETRKVTLSMHVMPSCVVTN